MDITDAQLKAMFNYDSIGGFDSDLADIFNQKVRELGYTAVGESFLKSYMASAGGGKINLIGNRFG